jgi:mannan endo-1,6-alpha-mannosidase
MLSFYEGDKPGMIPGILPGPPPAGPYYWWQGGAMWGTLLEYRHWTGDDSFDESITRAMLHQAGPNRDYMPANWSASMGNDDQAFWAMAAMSAAEFKYTDPPADGPQWVPLVQAVWNQQSRRPQNDSCGGGLRWQAFSFNNGYNYKNTISNACFLNMGARLALYTDDKKYADESIPFWDWMAELNYIDKDWNVFDGAHVENNCTDLVRTQYSYNAALLVNSAAYLYNFTDGSQLWRDRIEGLLGRIETYFFPNNTAYEASCEQPGAICNSDQTSFKGFVHRWLAITGQLVPEFKERIHTLLKESTRQGLKTCTGGPNGRMCGLHWTTGAFDGQPGAATQMNMVAALSSLLANDVAPPTSRKTGGTSESDPNAGGDDNGLPQPTEVTGGDRAGAGIVTVLLLVLGIGGYAWMSWP